MIIWVEGFTDWINLFNSKFFENIKHELVQHLKSHDIILKEVSIQENHSKQDFQKQLLGQSTVGGHSILSSSELLQRIDSSKNVFNGSDLSQNSHQQGSNQSFSGEQGKQSGSDLNHQERREQNFDRWNQYAKARAGSGVNSKASTYQRIMQAA